MKLSLVTILLTGIFILAGCAGTQTAQPETTTPSAPPSTESTPTMPPATEDEESSADALAGTQWVLESYGTPGSETAVIGETPLTLEFGAEGQVNGNAGCNSFAGTYQAQDDALVLAEIVSTLVACADSALMEQEVQYLDALQTVTTFQIEGDRLTINYDEGQGVLAFTRASTSPETPASAPTATPAPEAEIPTVVADEHQDFVWTCYTCIGNLVWNFENGQANQIEVPIQIDYFFGYAPATNRILYSTPLPAIGAGPSMIAVHDLWMLDVASGQSEPIFTEQNIVEAEWGADGEQLAYIRATESTYELRWHGLNGEDTLLASDVAFTFSVSPDGDRVAFTRESNYGLSGQPGLYVVDVATSEETMIAPTDRAGAGSIDDKPIWSPSGQHLLLPTYGTPSGPDLVRAAADGSNSTTIGYDPALAEEEWYDAPPFNAFWASDNQLIASVSMPIENAGLGGPTSLVLFQLNDTLDTIVAGEVIDEGSLIGWDVPGHSVWVQMQDGMHSIPLPEL